jgi:acetyl-CoA carboxylase biotin carboxyl carrier protein
VKIDLDQLKQILDLVREHELSELEIEQEGVRVKVKKDSTGSVVAQQPGPGPAAMAAGPPARAAGPLAPPIPVAAMSEGEADVELAVVKSPIVGTFYRSPEPGAGSFVEIGASVKKGQVLCIVEAMKLMNEIESDVDGVIAEIYPQNQQPIEYGEPLFAIKV